MYGRATPSFADNVAKAARWRHAKIFQL